MRSRAFKYGLIFLAWAAAVAFIRMMDSAWFEWVYAWRPAIWPYTTLFGFLELPGIALVVTATGVHGSGYGWIDDPVVIFGSAIFWFLMTIALMAVGSAIRRCLARQSTQPHGP